MNKYCIIELVEIGQYPVKLTERSYSTAERIEIKQSIAGLAEIRCFTAELGN